MIQAKQVFLALLEYLECKDIDYKIDEQWTRVQFALSEGRDRCRMSVDLHAYEEGSIDICAVVLKKQSGNIQTMR